MLKFSIITVVYNDAENLEVTIRQIRKQTYRELEYIVVDGGSTDDTKQVIKENEQFISKWISEPDKGIYHAMNKGLRLSSGDIIAFLNAGDIYFPSTLQKVNETFIKYKADVVYGNLRRINKYRDFCNFTDSMPNRSLSRMLKKPVIFHQACFMHKKIFQDLGRFSDRFQIAGDYHLILGAYLKGYKFAYLNEVLAGFPSGGASSLTCRFMENMKVQWSYGLYGSVFYSFVLMFKEIVKKKVAKMINYKAVLERKRKQE